jgi:hypothetical protein
MSRDADRRPELRLVDGVLRLVEVPDGVVLDDEEIAALRQDKPALMAVVEMFGPVHVEQVAGPRVWPPKGGVVPAWRRVRGKHLDVIPSHDTTLDVYAEQQPDTCPVCAGRDWHRAGAGWTCGTCHPPTGVALNAGWELVCPICGGKGRCWPNHDECLRRELERTLKRTRSPARRAQLAGALALLPPLPPKSNESRQRRAIRRWRPPAITTSRLPRT